MTKFFFLFAGFFALNAYAEFSGRPNTSHAVSWEWTTAGKYSELYCADEGFIASLQEDTSLIGNKILRVEFHEDGSGFTIGFENNDISIFIPKVTNCSLMNYHVR